MEAQKSGSKVLGVIGKGFIFLMAFYIGSKAFSYLDFQVKNILEGREAILKSALYFSSFYLHVGLGALALVTGPFQFVKAWRLKSLKFHRLVGRIYFFSCLISGVSGFYIAFFSNGGWIASAGFIVVAVTWLLVTWLGYQTIRSGNVSAHRVWMHRSYAITFTAVSLRVLIGVFVGLMGLSYDTAYQLVAWFAWVPNLIIVEIYLRRSAKKIMA